MSDDRAPAPSMPAGEAFLSVSRFEFARLRRLAEAAVRQVREDAALHEPAGPDGNSIAVLLRHVAGNLRSRWTDFLSTDGEKPDRNRDGEFETRPDLSRAELLAEWDAAFAVADAALDGLGADDLDRSVRIRGETFPVLDAVERQVVHLAYHVGQIVVLARTHAGAGWTSLSIPRGAPPAEAPRYRTA